MTQIPVWPMPLVPRHELILLGGTKQDRSRALFCMLLPYDGQCYNVAQVPNLRGREVDQDKIRPKASERKSAIINVPRHFAKIPEAYRACLDLRKGFPVRLIRYDKRVAS